MTSRPKGRKILVAPKRNSANKPAPKHNKQKPKKRNVITRFILWMFGIIWYFTWRVTAVIILLGIGILIGSIFYYWNQLPAASVLMDNRDKGSVTMLDSHDKVFAWRGDPFGGNVTVSSISPYLKNAIIATEDKRFYYHLGLSPRGIMGAMRTNIREGRMPLQGHGGSTITQQVAKLVYLLDLPIFERKIKEIPLSMAMELKYTKDEILSIYLNRVFLGVGYGFEVASQRFFGKSARNLTPAEAAMLTGLLKAPSANNPIRNLSRAQNRANLIIRLMKEQGYLNEVEATIALENPPRLSKSAADKAGGFFADWVLETAPEFLIKDVNADVIIKTTFDRHAQSAAKEALKTVFQKLKKGSNVQAAIVVMSPNGAVRAIIGGRDVQLAGSFNRATQALRQTGSAFKPFVYAAALDMGYSPETIVVDEPISLPTPSGLWSPKNYSRNYAGNMTLTTALGKSINTVAVKISEEIGRENVAYVAENFGINTNIPLVPALALGVAETTLLEMTSAYAGILNQGTAVSPFGLRSLVIQGDKEPLFSQGDILGDQVIRPQAARQLIYMMHNAVLSGTGHRAYLEGRQAAGKTGTTQGARDAWFIGFTADYVTGVWMGYDDNSKLTGVTGGGLPAEIWRETMLRLHADLPISPLPMYNPIADNGNPNSPQERPRLKEKNQIEHMLKSFFNRLFGN